MRLRTLVEHARGCPSERKDGHVAPLSSVRLSKGIGHAEFLSAPHNRDQDRGAAGISALLVLAGRDGDRYRRAGSAHSAGGADAWIEQLVLPGQHVRPWFGLSPRDAHRAPRQLST